MKHWPWAAWTVIVGKGISADRDSVHGMTQSATSWVFHAQVLVSGCDAVIKWYGLREIGPQRHSAALLAMFTPLNMK